MRLLLDAGETRLELGGAVRYAPRWLAVNDADALQRTLRAEVPWEHGAITLFGIVAAFGLAALIFTSGYALQQLRVGHARPTP